MTKYTSGAKPTGDPNARYRTPHSKAIGRISTEVTTSSALLARMSSSSCGSAPISATRANTAPAMVLVRRTGFTHETLPVRSARPFSAPGGRHSRDPTGSTPQRSNLE